MKKEDLVKLGLDETTAAKVADASTEELKGYIPKARFDEVNDANKQFKTDLAERNTQLEELKKTAGASEELKKQIETLQTANTTKEAEFNAKIMQMQIDTALKEQLSGVGVTGDVKVKMVKAILDLEKPEIVEGKIKGLDDQLKKLQEAEETKGMFAAQGKGQQTFKGMKPGESGGGKQAEITKEQFDKMGYSERVSLFNSNKELYDTLTATN
jgi:hypothetical protein